MKKILLIILILLILLFSFVFMVYAQDISSEGVTTITEAPDSEFVFNEIKKIYEISESSLEKGVNEKLNEKDAFRIDFKEKYYYVIVWEITDKVAIIFPGEKQLIFGKSETILADINQDNKLDIELKLNSIEDKKANLFVRKIIEKNLIPSGDYFELFDVTVRLAEDKIYSSRDLSAFIIFENFGEGPSEIDIVYSILNENQDEVYRGIDSKIVQTEDRVVKNFDFLNLPKGNYALRTEIFYGKNQTGESEHNFSIVEIPIISRLFAPLFFVFVILALLITVRSLRKFYGEKNIKLREGK